MFTLGSQTACDGLRDLWAPKVRAAASLDAPETLEALRASARPGDRVEVRRRPREGFDFRCGHSGLCLVVLPIALAVSVLPPLYDDASLSRGGQTRFRGAFDLRGRLVQGVIRDGGMQRELRRVHLPALDQDWLVEVARAPILPDGGVGPVTRTPIARQVDLVGPYRRAMIVARSPQARGGLAAEAVRTLGTDAVPIALERIAARDDEAVSTMFTNLCSASVPSQGVLIEDASFDAARTALLGAFVAAATPTASGAALSCAGLSAAQRTRLVQTLTREVCSGPPAGAARALAQLTTLDGELRCEGPRAPIVAALQERPADPAAVGRALDGEDEVLRSAVLCRLDPERFHAVLVRAQGPAAAAVLARLAASAWRPDLAQGRELLRRWAIAQDAIARVAVIDLLARLPRPAAEALRGEVDAIGDAGAANDTLTLRVALGDRARFADALRAMPSGHVTWITDGAGPNFTVAPSVALFAHAFWVSGCSEEEVRRGQDAVTAGRDPAACAGAAPWPRPTVQRSLWESEARRLTPR